jgi:hypothetical protein
MRCLAIDLLARICLSAEIDSFNQPDDEFVRQIRNTFNLDTKRAFLVVHQFDV